MRVIERKMVTMVNYYLSGGKGEWKDLGNTTVFRAFRSCNLYPYFEEECKATVTLFNNVIAYITEDYLYFTTQYASFTTKSRLNALIETFTNFPIKLSTEGGTVFVLRNFFTDFDCIPYGKVDTKQVTRNQRPALILPEYINWVRLPRKTTQGRVILYK